MCMGQIADYCAEVREIDGMETFIISPDFLDSIMFDTGMLSSLSVSPEHIRYMVDEAKENPSMIYLAFVRHHNIKMPEFIWQPVNCYRDGDAYYHVDVRNSWLCRECNRVNHGKFVMPKVEHEPVFYSMSGNPFPPVAPVFRRRNCTACGKNLQNHFASLSDDRIQKIR